MPPFSKDDVYKRLKNTAALETKIHRLEVNVEENVLCGNDSTLSWTQKSGHEHAKAWLISTNKTTKKQETCVPGNKSKSCSPPWKSLGAKPKSKLFPWEMGGRVTSRAEHPGIIIQTECLVNPRS